MALALKAFVFPVTTFSFLLAYVETLENLILTKNLNNFFSQSPKKPYTDLVVYSLLVIRQKMIRVKLQMVPNIFLLACVNDGDPGRG